jgi:ribosomal protein S18 acetylase RimI-like enzyme
MIEIKKIEQSDLTDLSMIFEELSGKPTNFNLMFKNFEMMKRDNNYFILGAIYDRKLVGSLMGIICYDLVGECKPFMVIENVIVSNKYRGQGIGKKLMLEIEKIAKERNCYYTMFVSGAQRKEAHKFYESLGYKLNEVQGFKKYLV